MRRPHTLLAALLLAAGTAAAQDYGQAATLKIWDNTTAPHSNGIATPEREPEPNRIADVSQAVLYIFPADPAKATGQAVVICPGGGYVKLCIDYEGYDMAKWFAANGITAAVLKYRMPNGHPEVPLEDVEQALRIMMGLEAGATGFTASKVGIVGSSAGGHLPASASTLAETKPAFSILFYPVITAEKGKGHQGSFNALKEHGVKASMHIYPTGGHGWGIRDRFKYKEQWQQATLDWLKELNDDRNTASVLLRQPGLPGCVDVGIRPATSRKSAGRELAEAAVQAAVQEFGQQVRSRRESDWPAGQ